MRITPCQAALAAAIALNLLLLLFSRLLPGASPPCRRPRRVPAAVAEGVPGVTVILRDFDGPEHDVAATARSFAALPGVPVLVAADVSPYPPVPLPAGVAVLSLRPEPHRPPLRPELAVRTRHVALVPDGARAAPGLLRRMRDVLEAASDGATKVVAAAVGRRRPRCLALEVDVKAWTARYSYADGQGDGRGDGRGELCGALDGAPAVLLLRTRDLFSLPFPLTRPVATSLSLQAAARGWRLLLLPAAFPLAPRPPPSPHAQRRARGVSEARRRALLEQFGVKLEVLPDGARRWHGCDKDTPRCFGTVRAQSPEYLLAGRWTPPCCLRALRATARHVLAQLEAAGVRHWLEGGSLLGAVRLGDVIPWDYDVDVGLYRDDVPKCRWLAAVAATGRPVEDPQGFLWEKAAEGEFFRVHFSRINRLHVDLWPFYARPGAGLMTKDTWLGHRQDVEFPERFLVPLGTVPFAGVLAKAPNDPRGFLELKFGPGAIESPEYPNPEVRRLAQDVGNKTSR
ncbi:ribitol 5-phosphate transferase FKRP-like [Anomalospiza imberbis]|uniref:ribitol 5-phosphate transferase FKRP-like n=1 Tax=Anomalospiza imberbis TaxID=187417 RepID=UPI00358E4F01